MTSTTSNASLSLADLLAPIAEKAAHGPLSEIHTGYAVPSTESTESTEPAAVSIPALDELLALAESVQTAQSTSDLPDLPVEPRAVPADEDVSYRLRHNGTELSELLRKAAGIAGHSGSADGRAGYMQSVQDIQYACRVFAAHAVRAFILNKRRDLYAAEQAAAEAIHKDWQDRVLAAVTGEVAAYRAGEGLNKEEFQHLLGYVDTGMLNIAQRLAGPDVDVQALAAGRGSDWRALALEWSAAAKTYGHVTFSDGNRCAATKPPVSYGLRVLPAVGWILSVWTDNGWYPIQSSPEAREQAVAEREYARAGMKHQPFAGVVFADDFAGVV